MSSIKDEKGYNQGFELVESTRIRMMRRAGFFLDAMDKQPGKKALEIGCGTGEVSYWIAQQSPLQILGTDISDLFISNAQGKYIRDNLKYQVLDFNSPGEVIKGNYDYVFGNGILHHLYYTLDESLQSMRQILKPGGKMIFMEPNIYNPYCQLIFKVPFLRKWANLEPDEMAFSPAYIRNKLIKAGYTNIKITYRDFLLPGIPSFLVKPSIAIGNIAERLPLIKKISQSIFIEAQYI
jgi:2-polyprenyl-3-methyl-5-hydroxy-6-metoxy-1,4-benzoquinol methylase